MIEDISVIVATSSTTSEFYLFSQMLISNITNIVLIMLLTLVQSLSCQSLSCVRQMYF